MEESTLNTKEEREQREKFRTELVRLSKRVVGQQEGTGPDLSMVPPHLMNRR